MPTAPVRLDDVPFSAFHARAAAFCGGSLFLDGYVLGVGGFALASWGPQVDLSSAWYGAIGSATLFGLFAGSLLFGWVTDRIGRKLLFLTHLLALLVLSPVQLFVDGPVELFTVRFFIGMTIGADFTIAMSLLSELVPRKQRGSLLASLNVLAIVGLALAYPAKAALDVLGDDSWRWLLASSTVPAAIVLLMRIGAPESPRWLAKQGRDAEARAVLDKFYGTHVYIDESQLEDTGARAKITDLFTRQIWRRTVFAGGFWACQAATGYAVYLFQGQISTAVGIGTGFWSGLVFNLFLLLGSVLGLPLTDRAPRRGLLLWTLGISAVALTVLASVPNGQTTLTVLAFAVFALVLFAGTNLQCVYPGELFPTGIRATGVGVATAISRIGACVGTFLLPITMDHFGVRVSLYGLAGVLVLGFVLSRAWAPETKDLVLSDAGRVPDGSEAGRTDDGTKIPQPAAAHKAPRPRSKPLDGTEGT